MLHGLIFAALPVALAVPGVSNVPAMGWNSWNYFGCGVNASILMAMADKFVELGLKDAGYFTVNSDDCWALPTRENGYGPQIPNPEKFPQGWKPVVSYINSKGLKAGLYTARSFHTCAGFQASCNFETVDANQYVEWGIEYLKDDDCGPCGFTVEGDYQRMNMAIEYAYAARNETPKMILSIEGQPDITVATTGNIGNSRRVGHDIQMHWLSAVSLIDIGSGLYPYAHNDTGNGGFYNDLDMLEVGNGDFDADASVEGKNMARAHFSLWCLMKAVLLMGNDLRSIGNETLAILKNKDAIAINQDTWGIQGRRIQSTTPKNTSLAPPYDNTVLLSKCDSSKPTQSWTYHAVDEPSKQLLIATCDASNAEQQWEGLTSDSGTSYLKNVASGVCIDGDDATGYSLRGSTCNSGSSQKWYSESSTNHIRLDSTGNCLDVFDFTGPTIFKGSCKTGGDQDSNQIFHYDPTTKLVHSALPGNLCMSYSAIPGGQISTKDSTGTVYCLEQVSTGPNPNGLAVVPCDNTTSSQLFQLFPDPSKGLANYTIQNQGGASIGWNSQFGASGPLPHTRWLSDSGGLFTMDPTAPTTTIKAASNDIIDDDNVGHVQVGGDFCLEASRTGNLEVWAGPLSAGHFSLVLFNRSPSPDVITANFSLIPSAPGMPKVTDTTSFNLFDIWANQSLGVHTTSYTASVPAHGVVFLRLSPT